MQLIAVDIGNSQLKLTGGVVDRLVGVSNLPNGERTPPSWEHRLNDFELPPVFRVPYLSLTEEAAAGKLPTALDVKQIDFDRLQTVLDELDTAAADSHLQPESVLPPEQTNRADRVWLVCSVSESQTKALRAWVAEIFPDDQFQILGADQVDLPSNVVDRNRLGRDRLVAAWYGLKLVEEQLQRNPPLIIVDAGTAVTIDLVDGDRIFQGGVIFPGADANFRQVAGATAALPGLQLAERTSLLASERLPAIGRCTTTAILQGIYQSQAGGIRYIVDNLRSCAKQGLSQPDTVVIATGGGIAELKQLLPSDWHFVDDAVLRGTWLLALAINQDIGR